MNLFANSNRFVKIINNIALFDLLPITYKLNGSVKRINKFVQKRLFAILYNPFKPNINYLQKFIKYLKFNIITSEFIDILILIIDCFPSI